MKKIVLDSPGINTYKIGNEGIVYGVKHRGDKRWGTPTVDMMVLGSVWNDSPAFGNYPVCTFSRELIIGQYPVALDADGSRILGRIISVKKLKN